MKEALLQLFEDHRQLALLISLGISIIVALLGLVPSFFVTAANIIFFGFWNGLLISFAGEALGAVLAFLLYRKGFKKAAQNRMQKYPRLQKLLTAGNREAFMLVLSLRLLPFVPSGLVTFAAAIGKISFSVFIVASSLGKIPALLLEGYAAYEVTRFQWQGKLILALLALALIFFTIRRLFPERKNERVS